MTQLNEAQQQVADFSSQLVQPYIEQLDSSSKELAQLKAENPQLKEQLQPFLRLLPLIERDDTFHLKLNSETFGQGQLSRLAVMASDLYPVLTKRFLDWKAGSGGKRPKDPLRQFIMDTLELLIDRPDWIRSTFKSGGCKHHRDH